MNLFKLPSLVKVPLYQGILRSEFLRKWLAVSPKYGAVPYSKSTVYADVGKRKIKFGVKDLEAATVHKDKLYGNNEFIIEDLKEENLVEAKKLLSKNYSSLNPLRSMLHVTYEDQMEILAESIPKRIGNKVSFVVRDQKTNKIIATCIPNIHSRPGDTSSIVASSIYHIKNIKIQHVNHILEIVRTSVNLYDLYNVEEVMEPSMVAIDQKFTGKGLLKAISKEIIKRARELEYRVLIGVPTHAVTQAYCKTMGGTLECEMDLNSILVEGKQVLDLKRNSGISSLQLYSFHL